MIPVRAPQDVTTLLRSMFAAVTPPRCESSSPHSTSTSALPRHSPSVPALAPQPSSPTSFRCRLPHPASPCTRVYTIAPAGRGHTLTAVFACPRCSIGSIPPHLAAASHLALLDVRLRPQCNASLEGRPRILGYCRILRDTAGYCWILAISDADTGILGGAGGPSSAQYCSIITWRLALRYWDTSPAWIDYCDTHRVRHHEYRSIRGTSSEY